MFTPASNWVLGLALSSIPIVYGGTIGVACPGRAKWVVLALGGVLISLALYVQDTARAGLVGLGIATLAPSPAVAAASLAAQRAAISPRGRLVLALLLAGSAAAAFTIADHLDWIPKSMVLDNGPVWGVE